jgi:hypothetical protein
MRDEGARPHDEATFRYLLEVEHRRADRTGRPFVLVLVDTPTAARAEAVFASLEDCLRETDFIGWYEHAQTAGAVLTELGDACGQDVVDLVRRKVLEGSGRPPHPAVRVSRYPAQDDPAPRSADSRRSTR